MGMPRINRGNEAAGAIRASLGSAGGATPMGNGRMPSVSRGTEAGTAMRTGMGSAGSTRGTNPGSPPQRGLTAPGMVEAFLAATMDSQRKTAPNAALPLISPIDFIRK